MHNDYKENCISNHQDAQPSLNIFPPAFFEKIDKDISQIIEINAKAEQRECEEIAASRYIRTPVHDNLLVESLSSGCLLGPLIGVCACTCIFFRGASISEAIQSWIVAAIIAGVVGLFVPSLLELVSTLDNRKKNAQIREVKRHYSGIKKEFLEKGKTDKKNYQSRFDKAAQEAGIKFADSSLTKEIVLWLKEKFYKSIDAADRRAHIEQVVIPFSIKVYVDKIVCNGGVFDFLLQRCPLLGGPVEQAGLTRAIASNLQVETLLKYPKDISGTIPTIEISYSYADEYSGITVSYISANGNYKPVRSW